MKTISGVFFIFVVVFSVVAAKSKWIVMTKFSPLPDNCHVGGYEDSPSFKGLVYIGRKQIEQELVIGKIIGDWKTAYFPKDGKEQSSDMFEILCEGSVKWVAKDSNKSSFVEGGKAGDGLPLHVCRGVYENQQIPGKYYEPTGCCYVGSFGKEYCTQDFTVLANA